LAYGSLALHFFDAIPILQSLMHRPRHLKIPIDSQVLLIKLALKIIAMMVFNFAANAA
jgi:hypothetical protein